jgi:hypothetical protein
MQYTSVEVSEPHPSNRNRSAIEIRQLDRRSPLPLDPALPVSNPLGVSTLKIMPIQNSKFLVFAALIAIAAPLAAQQPAAPKPEDTEIWTPETKRSFKNYQLHVEWKVPANVTGSGQARGNSGVFLASTGPGDAGYELQVLDSYNNKTYVNGMVASLYKQAIPLANPSRKPGEWQAYDIAWTAPTFTDDGSLKTPAYVTVFFNGVLVQNHFELKGQTLYIGKPFYKKYDSAPIKLQAHGDKSEPISYRNIWIRELN